MKADARPLLCLHFDGVHYSTLCSSLMATPNFLQWNGTTIKLQNLATSHHTWGRDTRIDTETRELDVIPWEKTKQCFNFLLAPSRSLGPDDESSWTWTRLRRNGLAVGDSVFYLHKSVRDLTTSRYWHSWLVLFDAQRTREDSSHASTKSPLFPRKNSKAHRCGECQKEVCTVEIIGLLISSPAHPGNISPRKLEAWVWDNRLIEVLADVTNLARSWW